MSHALVIAGRELAEKRFVFFAAIAFALLAVLLPLVPGMNGSPRDVIAVTSMILAAGFTLGLAGILGATTVGRDLSAGRLSFYFARPIGAASIWFGKLAAAAALVVAAFAIVILPGVIATGGRLAHATTMDTLLFATVVIAGSAAFFFAAHALSTMIRSRSVLIGLDFAAAIVAGAIFWQFVQPLLDAFSALRALLIGFGAVALVAFIVAGAWQLADGRTDRRRSHAAFSKALWSGLAVALLLAGGYVAWILSARPGDIDRILSVQPSPRGDWVIVRGSVRHRLDFQPIFLINAATGEARRLPKSRQTIFSADGTKFLDLQPLPQLIAAQVVIRDTASGRATPTDLVLHPSVATLVATDDLSRLTIFEGGLLTVYDVAARRAIGSVRLHEPPCRIFFASPGLVRIYTSDRDRLDAYEFDAAHRALRATGSLDAHVYALRASADGARVVTMEPAGVTIRDARTLQPLGNDSIPPQSSRLALLRDGRIVTVDGHTLHVAGTRTAIDLGAGSVLALLDLGGGKVAASMAAGRGAHWITVADIDRGAVVRRDAGLMFTGPANFDFDPRPLQWSPNLIVLRGPSLLRWNALTGETKVLVPG